MKEHGIKLTAEDIDQLALKISAMYNKFNEQRNTAMKLGQEVRNYIFATSVDTTTSSNIDTKNRTHIPKLTELADTLRSNYWEAIFGDKRFFIFEGSKELDRMKAKNIEAWLQTKFEMKKFRQIEGRKLIDDYVIYGNAFFEVDYIVERNSFKEETFKGVVIRRISPLDICFDVTASSFKKSPKIVRMRVHISDLEELPTKFPSAGFDIKAIKKLVKSRQVGHKDDWIDTLTENNLAMDGFANLSEYFNQDFVEILIFRGDIYNPKKGESERHRIIWVADRVHIIRNEKNPAPGDYDGMHHVAWRTRPDNLWGMGALDNLGGMQYRVNKIENKKADVLDLLAHPITIHKSNDSLQNIVTEIYKAGNTISIGVDDDISFESPDATILQHASTHIAEYFRLMENFAGAPPEERGIRTPGEKTAEEIRMIDSKTSKLFKDKTDIFEIGLETVLEEAFSLTLSNFDGEDFIEIFNDIEGKKTVEELSLLDIKAQGTFRAIGSKHWDRKNKRKAELQQILSVVLNSPKFASHLDGWNTLRLIEEDYQLENTGVFEKYRGIKEDVEIQAIAQAEMQQLGQAAAPEQTPPQG